jgi:hypothetical protein
MHTTKSSETSETPKPLDATNGRSILKLAAQTLTIAIACIAGFWADTRCSLSQDFSPYLTVDSPAVAVDSPAEPLPNALAGDLGELNFEIPDSIPTSKLRLIDGAPVESDPMHFPKPDAKYRVYRSSETTTGYMPGDGEQFGWLDFTSMPYLASTQSSGFTTAMGLHLLSGPNSIPLPPRLPIPTHLRR